MNPNDAPGFAANDPMMVAFGEVRDSCLTKGIISAGLGFALGGVFGLFMSSVDWNSTTEEFQKLSTKEQLKLTAKDMGNKSFSSAKNFALVGAIYASSECVIESFRAKNDLYNSMGAGCFSGGVLAARAGPQAALFGCASFAAFSTAIDYWIRHSD